jgi:hypothetical protein
VNVHGIISKMVHAINPNILVQFKISQAGYQTDAAGNRTPAYSVYNRHAQVQAINSTDLQILTDQGINIQGYHRRFWANGTIEGLNRGSNTQGDLIITPDGRTWKITMIDEIWPDWTSGIMTLQNVAG